MNFFRSLVVFLVVSEAKAEWNVTENGLILEGNETFLEDFEGVEKMFQVDGHCAITEVVLKFVRVRRSTLANFLANCTNLTSLTLTEVEWEWKTETNFEIYLPNLNTFQFQQIRDSPYAWSASEALKSVIFFYTNGSTGTGVIPALQNLNFDIYCYTAQDGLLNLRNAKVEVKNIKDESSWTLLYIMTPSVEAFYAKYCTIDVRSLNLTSVKYLDLEYNDLIGGTISQLIESAVVLGSLTISSKVPEAIDVALLPAKSLFRIETKSLSFRYNSAPPHLRQQFTKLRWISVTFGDIDLGIFSLTKAFRELEIYNSYLWNTKVDDILKSYELDILSIDCQYLDDECPVIDLGSPEVMSLKELLLQFVEVRAKKLPVRPLPNVRQLGFMGCTIDGTILDNIGSIFPNVVYVRLDMEDVLSQRLLLEFVKHRPQMILIKMPAYDPREKVMAQFKRVIRAILNATFPASTFPGGHLLPFTLNGKYGYLLYDNFHYGFFEKEYRIASYLKLHGFSNKEITPRLLSQIYTTYMTVVYCACGIGLISNCLSFVVLMRKAMLSSTSMLLIGLTCCDSMYLISSFGTSEEFGNLFNEKFLRSKLNGYLAYPVNKTMYTASVYMTILVTVERFVAIAKPLQVSSIFTIHKARHHRLLVFGFATFLNLPRWLEFVKWSYEASSPAWSRSFPRQLHRFPLYQTIYQQVLWYTFIYLVPIVAIVTLNILIVKKLTKAARERRLTATTHSTAHDSSLTRMLLSVVFVFILLNSLAVALELNFILKGVEPEVAATIVSLPILINSALNFILYACLGSKFRKELKLLLTEVGTWISTSCTRRRIRRSNSIQLRQHRAT